MAEDMTPKKLSLELGVPAPTIRRYLREKHGRVRERFETRWHLTDAQVADLRAHFSQASRH